jgi:hypothetical protein
MQKVEKNKVFLINKHNLFPNAHRQRFQHYSDAKTVITQTAALVRTIMNSNHQKKKKKLKCGAAMQKPHSAYNFELFSNTFSVDVSQLTACQLV